MLSALLAAILLQPSPSPDIVLGGLPYSAAEAYAATVTGTFTSAAQHRADPAFDEVEVRIVRIWPKRKDGVWLYQEQAIVNRPGMSAAEARRRPYFQFVARVVEIAPGVLRRDNYRVRDGAAWLGLAAGDPRQANLGDGDLNPPSCHNRIERVAAGYWIGRTESCANNYKGAAFMQSLSIAQPDLYANWDRGFDAAGKLVWGPATGGYLFRRLPAAP